MAFLGLAAVILQAAAISMRIFRKKLIRFLACTCIKSGIAFIALIGVTQQAMGQVTPNEGTTGTEVTLTDTESTTNIDITGGRQSGDGANLFHNFEQFDIDAGQSARFITTPDVQNVLSIITGGPSTIDGLLQVLGSQADLYLINSAGILFGPNAQLNLPGSLSATTATGIGFDEQWLSTLENSLQPSDYSRFVGDPTAFDFSGESVNIGAVVNLGDLTLGTGQSLSLIGGTVVNTGAIVAPGGKITLTAVEGNQLVRIGQGDQLLSLEVSPTAAARNSHLGLGAPSAAPTLSELLTGGSIQAVDTLIENADGTVSLVSTGTVIREQSGTAVISGQLSTEGEFGGEINIFGTQVALLASELSAAGRQGGGTLRLGGDTRGSDQAPTAQQTYIGKGVVLNASATHRGDGGQIYIWSDESTNFYGSLRAQGGYQGGNGGFAEISSKRSLAYDGEVSLLANQGDIGTLLFDPNYVLIKDGADPGTTTGNSIWFTLYEKTLEALSESSNIEIEANIDIVIENLTDNELTLSPGSNLSIEADVNENGTGGFSMDASDTIRAPGGTVEISAGYSTGYDLRAGAIDTSPVAGQVANGDIVLSASLFVQAEALNAGNGTIEINSNNIDLSGGDDSVIASSVTLQPMSPSENILIGDDDDISDALNISVEDIAALASSIKLINIGRSNGTGQVTLLADTADGTGNGFMSPTHIRGSKITLAGPNLDTVWTLDYSSENEPVNTLSTHSNVLFYDVSGIVGGNGNDTINFLDYRPQISDLIDGGAGDLTLVGNDLYIPSEISGKGNLFIRTRSPNVAIELGGTVDPGAANTLNLLNEELSSLFGAAFESVTIGDENSGTITLRDNLAGDSSLTLQSSNSINALGREVSTTGRSPLTLLAESDISAGHISTEGGDITIESTEGDVTATSIDATGATPEDGEGGDIVVSATNGAVQIGGYIDDNAKNPSIETNPSNTIDITHGGNGAVPFIVGSASANGTAGTITTQTNTIGEDRFLDSFVDGDISVLTQNLEEAISLLPVAIQAALRINADDSSRSSSLTVLSPNLESMASQEVFSRIESAASAQFTQFLSTGDREIPTKVATRQQVQDTLSNAQKNLSIKPALVYVYFVPDAETSGNVKQNTDDPKAFLQQSSPNDQLEVMLISGEGEPIRRRRWGVTRAEVEAVASSLRYEATSQFSRPQDYLPPAQQLYRWIMQPLEYELGELQIDNLAFIMDDGLRTIPLAVLHDGDAFLVERYSLGLMPTFSLTDLVTSSTEQMERDNSQVLAMGASRFSAQPPLPAVEAELSLVAQELWQGEAFLNEHFTLDNLKTELSRDRYDILHLATHAVFNSGDWDNSYIQLWNERVTLNELDELNLKDSDIGLIILSACNTALGDRASEYGFAGFAVNAGSESALASLWPVSDEGTLGFMTQFYQQLSAGKLRSDSLRQAQISMLQGEVSIVNGQVIGPDGEAIAMIPELAESGNWDFAHPFYWSAFTMIGNPW